MKDPSQKTSNILSKDDVYLKIWEAEQRHITTRWTVTTFFLSVSFAIFGISLQVDKNKIPIIIPQLVAIAIYWFTYLLFLRFNGFTRFLRSYLTEMESSKETSLELQTKARIFMNNMSKLSATQLLFYFGLVYTIAGLAIGLSFR